jgi:HEAT repeat protein
MKKHFLFWTPPAIALGIVIAVFVLPGQLRLKQALRDPNPAVRANALRRGAGESRVIESLQDEDPDVRCVAAERLGVGGSSAARAKALIPLLMEDHTHVRRQAAFSLADIGPSAWPALQEALKDANPHLRSGVARALPDIYWGKNGWNQAPMLSALDELLSDADGEVRDSAKYAIDRFRR